MADTRPATGANPVAETAALEPDGVPRHVHRALALVERSLKSEEAMLAVQRETGGTAPELVQEILDGIARLYRRAQQDDSGSGR